MRRIAALALLALAGCGGGAPSSVVPADATIYVGLDASEAEVLLAGTSRADVDFERDVQPWLGDRAGYFASAAADESGLVFDAEDEDAAEAFGRKVTAAGPLRASGMIDGRLVLASSRELLRAASAAAGGESLADSTRLDVAGEDEDGAPDVLLAMADPSTLDSGRELFDVLPEDAPVPEQLGGGPLTVRTWRERGHVRAEIGGLPPERAAAPSLGGLPGAAWLAVASGDMSARAPLALLREALEDLDRWPSRAGLDELLQPHLGPGSLFLQGRSRLDVGGRLVAETGDETALRRAVVTYARGLPRRRYHVDLNLNRPGGDPFLQLLISPRRPLPVSFFLQVENGRVALDMGREPGGVAEDLEDTPRYRDAQRRLRGAPTLLIEEESGGYLAAHRDGETLRVVSVYG